jgi:anaerobic selenocysteine-containing dehydrogenase
MHIVFGWEKGPLGKQRRRWWIILKLILERDDGVEKYWTDLAKDRDQWRALVNTVMNLRVP